MWKNPISIAKGAYAMFRIVQDPTRLDEVFDLADALQDNERLDELMARLGRDPVIAAAFESRPRLDQRDPAPLAALPEGTLGRAYLDFMESNGLSWEALLVAEDDGSPGGWFFAHLRESHDIWHVATGFGTDVAGELGLQAFYLAQIESPLPPLLLSAGMLNTFLFGMEDRDWRMENISRGWLMGKRAKTLVGFDWSAHWDMPLAELRRELRIDPKGADLARAEESLPPSSELRVN